MGGPCAHEYALIVSDFQLWNFISRLMDSSCLSKWFPRIPEYGDPFLMFSCGVGCSSLCWLGDNCFSRYHCRLSLDAPDAATLRIEEFNRRIVVNSARFQIPIEDLKRQGFIFSADFVHLWDSPADFYGALPF